MRAGSPAALATALLALIAQGCSNTAAEPERDVVFTSTRYVTGIAIGPGGTVWASTRGGVLVRDRSGRWSKLTRADGLPSNQALGVEVESETITILFAHAIARRHGGQWKLSPRPSPEQTEAAETCRVTWRGRLYTATPTGLLAGEGDVREAIPLPPSTGSHISALLPRAERLWAAMFGDGIWEFDGSRWARAVNDLPEAAREVTALAASGDTIWVGTRREGLWERANGTWKQLSRSDEPYDHNCQSLCAYRGELFVSTLEDGLVVRGADGWRRVAAPELSSNAPRQMVEFQGSLYVRHGNGKVDRLDGSEWSRDVCSEIPRKQASAIAVSEGWLLMGQWGGWSEFDGREWTHHCDLPELQGVQTTALLADGDRLWIGTQGKGLAEIDRKTRKVAWHDERVGLPDDWVRCIERVGDTLYVGTFVGGLAWYENGKWKTADELSGQEVTAIASSRDGVLIATRMALWRRSADGNLERLKHGLAGLIDEAQALLPAGHGTWVGARTGLYYMGEP